MPSKEQIIEVESLPVNIQTGATYTIKQANPNSYTHGMFKYPCKFIPEIPRWGIKTYLSEKRGVIFDPFSGSGTTLLEANVNGLDAYGTEIDDIAKLIIKVKTTVLGSAQMKLLDQCYSEIINTIGQDDVELFIPAIANLEHWFSENTINELGRMKAYIDNIEDKDVRDFFKLCMASIIKRVSNADDTSPKPYVSNKIIKIPPTVEKEFTSVFRRYRQMMQELTHVKKMGNAVIIQGDALEFSVPLGIDLAITSPPYINAFDYGRTMRLENLWLDTLTEEMLRKKKSQYVGTEKINRKKEKSELGILEKSDLLKAYYNQIVEQDEKRALIVKKFFEDMEDNLRCVYSQMNICGKYVIVIGNSTIRKVNVESWRVIEEIANKIGFKTVQYFNYVIQNPYIRIPRKGMGGKINKDYVLVLEKGA
ncbi:modification methylase [Roseburia sp. OM04-10BH]|uniref:DNA methyltransferase n=1 Tax=unclassified Roseburia TaxID=2637578 RepID=UPI000E4F699D|nr:MULTISPECIES: DNA methyltransferase [unclassified Roseburia]RGI42164.1 modification methylase [Roseburia sp. OM04-10BH]RHV38440.1 modification methylase [Roseburia sp. OM04-15AA]RHV58495.1 modification methylase [Roseburia sp. OM04-10AA]